MNAHVRRMDAVRRRDEGRTDAEEDPQPVLDALDDPDCRAILRAAGEDPMTASELSEACDLPSSTTYRKIDLLVDASLLGEGTRIRRDGKHASQYRRIFEGMEITVTDGGSLAVEVFRSGTPSERLTDLWNEVRHEAQNG